MTNVNRVVHEPARLRILMLLAGVDLADFNFLLSTLGLTKGNLSSHIDRLERAGYVQVRKSFNGRIPHTDYCLTDRGRQALTDYWAALDHIRGTRDSQQQ
jgi:DNA-binding MarR family transcriptional regulator